MTADEDGDQDRRPLGVGEENLVEPGRGGRAGTAVGRGASRQPVERGDQGLVAGGERARTRLGCADGYGRRARGNHRRALAKPADVLVGPVASHRRTGGPPAGGERLAHGGADNAGAGELAVGGADALVGLVGGGDPDPRATRVGEADEVVGLRPAYERAGYRLMRTARLARELVGEAGESAGQRPPPRQR